MKYATKSFKSTTCINIFVRKLFIIFSFNAFFSIELREYDIPNFNVSIIVNILSSEEKMKEQIANGEKPNINLYFAGKNAIEDFKAGPDLIISLCNVMNGRPSFGLSKGGGEIPWYVFELPVIGISVNLPTMLADLPMLRTYINAYDSEACTMEKLVDKLLEGPEAFKGSDPIDSFCGLFATKI